MPQEADFPGLDVQKCYEILETLGDKTKRLSAEQINAMKEQFWHILESEITKINNGYTEREELCCKRFQMFDFRTFIISRHNQNMSVCRLFQEALREVYNHFETAQMSSVMSNMPKTEKNNENLFYYAQYHSFCELLRDVHLLRDFTIQTFQILTVMISNLKKHLEQHAHLYANSPHSLSAELSAVDRRFKLTCALPLYTSPILAKLATRTEVIATSLLCAQNACAPQQTAFVCFNCHSLSKDMFVLRCFHRFCEQCAAYLKQTQQTDCPTCGRHDALVQLEKDEPLRSFISTHFGANLLKHDEPAQQQPMGHGQMQQMGMQPMPGQHIKAEPKNNALIPPNGMRYYNEQVPAYLIPTNQLKDECADPDQPMKGGRRGRPRGRGRGRPKGSGGTRGGGGGSATGNGGGGNGGGRRHSSSNSLHAARTKIKNGGRAKTSCHQCKNNKDPSELLFCKNVKWGPGKKKGNMVLKHCRKKFCAQCMGKYETIERVDELFRLQEDGGLTEWQCPACADTCECAACWRKRHPNSGAGVPKPEQSQSNSLSQSGTPQHNSRSASEMDHEMEMQPMQPPHIPPLPQTPTGPGGPGGGGVSHSNSLQPPRSASHSGSTTPQFGANPMSSLNGMAAMSSMGSFSMGHMPPPTDMR